MSRNSLSPREFLSAIRIGQQFDILLLHGNEEYLLRLALDEYVERNMPREAFGFDFAEFRASEIDGKTLWNALTTMPLMAARRLVVLDVAKSGSSEVGEAISKYIEYPSPSSLFVMHRVVESRGEGRGFSTGDAVVDVEFKELRVSERATWIREFVRNIDKTINEDAVQYLLETSTASLGDIASKLDHAALFIGEEKEITTKILMQVTGVSSEYTVFNLEDAILAENAPEAHRIASSLLGGGEAILRLMAFHRTTVMRLWQISRAMKKSASWQDGEEGRETWNRIKREMGRQSFKLSNYKKVAGSIQESRIREAVRGLVELEVQQKSGAHESFRYFEWLWKLTTSGRFTVGTSA